MCDIARDEAQHKTSSMLSDLAVVDWIALLVALFVLGVAGIAAFLTRISVSAEVTVARESAEPAGYAPSHAVLGSFEIPRPTMPMHAAPVPEQADSQGVLEARPAPPIFTGALPGASVSVGRATNPSETIDLTSDREETVAERAARLRS